MAPLLASLLLQNALADTAQIKKLTEVFQASINGAILPTIGDTIDWANGKLKRSASNELLYTGKSAGGCSSIVFNADTNPKQVAVKCPDINALWKSEFGVDLASQFSGLTIEMFEKERLAQVGYTKVLEGALIPKAGETFAWASGMLTRIKANELRYTSDTGGDGCTSVTMTKSRSVAELAIECPNINAQWIKDYGINLASAYQTYNPSGDASRAAIKANFTDVGFKLGKVRSEYERDVGTGSSPLTLTYPKAPPVGCFFSTVDNFFGCPGYVHGQLKPEMQMEEACGGDKKRVGDTWVGCTTYKQSPYFEINKPKSEYFVTIANSEPAFDQCNDGPPGLSQRITDPTGIHANLYKVGVEDISSSVKRAHLVINMSEHHFYCPRKNAKQLLIPFLSVGAHNGFGQNGPVAYMNRNAKTNKKIKWTSKIQQYQPFTCTAEFKDCVAGVHSGIYAISKWDGKNHLVFIDFIGEGAMETLYDGTHNPNPGQSDPKRVFWNWPIAESFYYPGAELAYLTTTSLERMCGIKLDRVRPATNKDARDYELDITRIFACVSDQKIFTTPMPSNQDVALEGFHWYMETIGSAGWMWESFENPRAEF